MLRSLQAVLLVAVGAAVVAGLILIAIKHDAAVDHAGAPLWRSPGEVYRICSSCGQWHTDLNMPRCMRCKTPFVGAVESEESAEEQPRSEPESCDTE